MREPLDGVIELPDGTVIRGRGRREPAPDGPLPDFGLYLGKPSRTLFRRRSKCHVSWPAEWIDWPDFRTPRNRWLALTAIEGAYLRAHIGERVEVACDGGAGRTGTVIACMAVLAGHSPDDAVAWTRRNYRKRAVETPGQRRWVHWFAHHHTG